MTSDPWLLPEGVDERLPEQAADLEALRRRLLDLFFTWGYQLVDPPFIEYLESLLVGTGRDLDLMTFKLIDQVSGRLLGVRADITPQAARMDAHQLRRETPTRLCYLGTVLHTRSEGFPGSRNPLQIGAELFGHAGIESDIEVLRLMMRLLELAGAESVHLDLGHVGLFRGLARQAGLEATQEAELFDALQRKAIPEIEEMLARFRLAPGVAGMLRALADLNGEDVLDQARSKLAAAIPEVGEAIEHLAEVAAAMRSWLPEVRVNFDLAELRGYNFHTGIVFAAYVPGLGREILRGGRYDGVGKIFGRDRPATGFSADLKLLADLGRGLRGPPPGGIFAPWSPDPELQLEVERLRARGMQVIGELPGQSGGAAEMGCDRVLVRRGGRWELLDLPSGT